MSARYEGWYVLGPWVFDEQLDRFREITVTVLREHDPKFALPQDKRLAAFAYDKRISHSQLLRTGLAVSLALLGSHPKALTSCSTNKPEITAILTVREVLEEADWRLWASLNDVLPLLAEAAPREFLNAIESALNNHDRPFDTVFAQEGTDSTGWNYMTGLLWALETLAWDSEHLTRVIVLLGELASRDPGGSWSNRPSHSMTTILLPWLPQTCASVPKRKIAVENLLREFPEIAWKLLLGLMPSAHQISTRSRKPAWREMIPDAWTEGVNRQEYEDQIAAYSDLAILAAKSDLKKLTELIDHLVDLPPIARDQLLSHLGSESVVSIAQEEKLQLWTKLVHLISKHQKFADSAWAMKPEALDRITAVAEKLAPDTPMYRHQRLFSEREFNLYEEKGNYEEQQKQLDHRRQEAVDEIFSIGGVEAVFEFAKAVQSPWRVGFAFGVISTESVDEAILPASLESQVRPIAQLAGGFVWGRFRTRGWKWIDEIDTSSWDCSQTAQLLAYLPFTSSTWDRATQLLGENVSQYWTKTGANPYQSEGNLEFAIDRLLEHDRAYEALTCLEKLRHEGRLLDSKQAVRVLRAVLNSPAGAPAMDAYDINEVIKSLQNNPDVGADDICQLEWAFLPILDRHHGASPKRLEQRLADDPAFFCDVVRTVFRSKKEERPAEELAPEKRNIAENAYRLLSEWRTPPGLREDGSYDGKALTDWLEKVKTACAETGHLEVGLSRVGHVLVYTPSDPDGLWLHHSAAEALNAKDANDLRWISN